MFVFDMLTNKYWVGQIFSSEPLRLSSGGADQEVGDHCVKQPAIAIFAVALSLLLFTSIYHFCFYFSFFLIFTFDLLLRILQLKHFYFYQCDLFLWKIKRWKIWNMFNFLNLPGPFIMIVIVIVMLKVGEDIWRPEVGKSLAASHSAMNSFSTMQLLSCCNYICLHAMPLLVPQLQLQLLGNLTRPLLQLALEIWISHWFHCRESIFWSLYGSRVSLTLIQ